MLTNVMKLYAGAAGDGAAVLDVPEDCLIQGVLFNLLWSPDAITEAAQVELSFASTSGFTSNDTRASFCGISARYAQIAAGTGGAVVANESVTGLLVPCAAGERIYMHIVAASAASIGCSAWLYCLVGEMSRRSRRRT